MVGYTPIFAATDNANANAGAKPTEPPLPPKAPRAVFNEDGSPAGDAALGIPPDPPANLPEAAIEHRVGRHKVSRGPVEPEKFPTRPQQVITKLR